MRVNSVQNEPKFGMAFRVNAEGAKKLAEKFHGFSDPRIAEADFAKCFVKPVENFKSYVIYDGKDVFVRDHLTGDIYQVMKDKPLIDSDTDSALYYQLKNKAKHDSFIRVEYFKSDNFPDLHNIQSADDVEIKLSYAKEIVKEMDRESIEDTTARLNKIYG